MKFFLLSFFIFCAYNCFSKNYFVNAKTGKKEYNGLSPMKPKNTIQEAANLTRPGDTVFVMNGTYSNHCASCNVVDVPHSGTRKKYIVYINYPDHTPKIKFNGWAGFSINGESYIKIIGFEVEGNNMNINLTKALNQPKSCRNPGGEYAPEFNGNGIAISARKNKHPHHIVIARNTVHNCGGGGIGASHADFITIEDNTVYNNSWYTLFGTSGIAFYQFWNSNNDKGYRNIIRRNKCFNNKNLVPWPKVCRVSDGNGIIVDDFRNEQNNSRLGKYKGRTLIENNICWFNGGTGIHTFQSDFVDIVNNTAYCNSQSVELNSGQILASRGRFVRIINNILVADSFNDINSNYENRDITYLNNLHYNTSIRGSIPVKLSNPTCINNLNPLFIKPVYSLDANFMLRSNSPAINKGNTPLGSKTDFNNKERPLSGITDIGAYEY